MYAPVGSRLFCQIVPKMNIFPDTGFFSAQAQYLLARSAKACTCVHVQAIRFRTSVRHTVCMKRKSLFSVYPVNGDTLIPCGYLPYITHSPIVLCRGVCISSGACTYSFRFVALSEGRWPDVIAGFCCVSSCWLILLALQSIFILHSPWYAMNYGFEAMLDTAVLTGAKVTLTNCRMHDLGCSRTKK